MFTLYGKKARCFWCGKDTENKDTENIVRDFNLPNKKSDISKEKLYFCSLTCQERAIEEANLILKTAYFFLVFFLFGFFLIFLGFLFSLLNNLHFALSILGIILVGFTLIVFPIAVPFTIKIFGIKKAIFTCRLIGFFIFLFGFLLIFL